MVETERASISTYMIGADGRSEHAKGIPDDVCPSISTFQWVRVQHKPNEEQAPLLERLNLPAMIVDALLAPETQPRFSKLTGGVLLVLRGVSAHPLKEPDDMVSVRLWIEPTRIVSVQLRQVLSIDEIAEACDRNEAPQTIGRFVFTLIDGMSAKVEAMVTTLVEQLDGLEEESLEESGATGQQRLSELRRQLVVVRRYVAPQRAALERLSQTDVTPLNDSDRILIREISDQTVRLVDELDAARERATVINDTLLAQRAEEMNRNMLVLSVVAAVFLPLGFLTGLLGINVGGLPGVESPYAFWVVCALSGALAGVLVLLFKRLDWI